MGINRSKPRERSERKALTDETNTGANMSNQKFEYENFTITPIGRTDNGIDGSDEYVQLDSIDGEPLTTEQIDQLFWEKWRVETYQEAGGYFCKSYSVFFHQYGNDRAVMCINHRYDV